jgi:hypothetical protein
MRWVRWGGGRWKLLFCRACFTRNDTVRGIVYHPVVGAHLGTYFCVFCIQSVFPPIMRNQTLRITSPPLPAPSHRFREPDDSSTPPRILAFNNPAQSSSFSQFSFSPRSSAVSPAQPLPASPSASYSSDHFASLEHSRFQCLLNSFLRLRPLGRTYAFRNSGRIRERFLARGVLGLEWLSSVGRGEGCSERDG